MELDDLSVINMTLMTQIQSTACDGHRLPADPEIPQQPWHALYFHYFILHVSINVTVQN